jgi:hypothetical protein
VFDPQAKGDQMHGRHPLHEIPNLVTVETADPVA